MEKKIPKLEKDIATAKNSLVHPDNLFRERLDLYSGFDDMGIPTHLADGTEISKKKSKKFGKQLKTHAKAHAKTMNLLNENPNYIADLEAQLESIKSELSSLQS